MGKSVERQNLSVPFFVLSWLIVLATGWAIYDELWGRRGWKRYQEEAARLERSKLERDLAYYEAQLDGGHGAATAGARERVDATAAAIREAWARPTQIAQRWMPKFDGTVDRCESCHVLIDRCGFSAPWEVLAELGAPGAEPTDVAARYCLTPLTVEAYRTAAAGLCATRWRAAGADGGSERCLDGRDRDRVRMLLADYCSEQGPAVRSFDSAPELACAGGDAVAWVENLLGAGEQKADLFFLPRWARTHPHKETLIDGAHPAQRFGCTACHEGQGAQTKGVFGAEFAHGWDDPYWERPLLDLVAFRRSRPTSFGPPPPGGQVEGRWVSRQRQFVQSTCAKCHPVERRLRFAETYALGRRLAVELGCPGCHPVAALADEPKLGPPLTALRQKMTPEALATWVGNPRALHPRTRMPDFWPEAFGPGHQLREQSPEAALRAEQVAKLTAFLWKSSEGAELPALPVRGDAARGARRVQELGCRACHNLVPPERWCTEGQAQAGEAKGTPAEPGACEVARFVPGAPARAIAPDLWSAGLSTNERWLFTWLKDPRSVWPAARMPSFRLSDAEAADIAAYLVTLRGGTLEKVPAWLSQGSGPELDAAAIEGGKLVSHYGCAGCHDVRGHEADAKVGAELDEVGRKSPEFLDFGNAVPNPRWRSWYTFVDLKLRAPRVFRYERFDARMPQYDLTDAEADALMVYLRSLTGDRVPEDYRAAKDAGRQAVARGDRVLERYNCQGCHVIDGEGGALRDVYRDDDQYQAPPLLTQEGARVQPGWLFSFLKAPEPRLRAWLAVRMPTFGLSDAAAGDLVAGFSAAAKVPYPYVSTSSQPLPPADAAQARALVSELQCLKCHTEGQPPAGVERAALAPDFALSKNRLRTEWVRRWLLDPQALQDGTRMPAYFTPDDLDTPMYPQLLGGSQRAQIELLTRWVQAASDGKGGAAQPPKAR